MSPLNDNDLFIVERDGTNYQVPNSAMSTLRSDDKFMVERAGTLYQVNYEEFETNTGALESPVEVLTPLNGAGIGAGQPYNPISSAITAVGDGGFINYQTSNITAIDFSRALPIDYGSHSAELYEIGPGLAALGVTGIKGIRLEGGADYTSYIFDLQIDGQTVRDGTITPASSGTQYSSNTTWEKFFADPTDTQYAQGITSYSCTFTEIDIAEKSVKLRADAYDGAVTRELQLLAQDDQWVTILGGPNGIDKETPILTFADPTNLDKFQVGDVVQGRATYSDKPINVDPSAGGGVDAAFDGQFGSNGAVAADFSKALGFEFSPPLTDVVTCQLAVNNNQGTLTYVDDNDVEHAHSWLPNGSYVLSTNTPAPPSSIKKILWNTGQITAISINGTLLVNGDEVKVTSVDAENSKMATDGGQWGIVGIADGVNTSEVWSDMSTPADPSFPETLIFDSDDSSNVSYAPAGGTTEIAFDPEFTDVQSLSIKTQNAGSFAGMLLVNGADVTPQLSSNNDYNTISFTGDTLSSISYATSDGSNYVGIYAIKVDGNRLEDTSGAVSVSKDTVYDTTITCSDDAELDDMVGPIAMTDENGDLVAPQTSAITQVLPATYRVGYPNPESLGTNDSPTLVPVAAADIDACDVVTFVEGQTWERGSDGSSPGYQAYLIVDQGAPGIPSVYLNANLSGASYSLFASDTGKAGTWTFAGTVLPETAPMLGTGIGRYVCFVRNANGDSVGVTSQSGTPALRNEPLYFTTPAIPNYLPLSLASDGSYPGYSWDYVFSGPANSEGNTLGVGGSAYIYEDQAVLTLANVTSGSFEFLSRSAGSGAAPVDGLYIRVKDDSGNLVGNTINTFSAFADGATWKIINADNVRTIEVGGADPGVIVTGIRINGVDIIKSTLLTFTDDTDLEYFSPGDVVQSGAASVVSVDTANSQMAVSGGEWSTGTGKVWSSFVTGSISEIYGPENIFDGGTGLSYENGCTATVGNVIVWEPDEPITGVNTLEIGTYGNITLNVNGIEVPTPSALGVEVSIDKATYFSDGVLTNIDWGYPDGSNYMYVTYIKVNGALLIDSTGDNSVSLPTLEASAADVIQVDGNTLRVDGTTGPWRAGLHIKGATISSSAPSPDSIAFTSSNGGTTAVTGTDATLSSRTWTLQSGSSATGPWTTVGTYEDFDASASQDGAVPWTSNKPVLEPFTFYQVKVRYNSLNADSVESVYSTFKTGER